MYLAGRPWLTYFLLAIGVCHAAGVLADGVLLKQSANTLARVLAPKAHGASVLGLTARTPLHACVFFSSTAALLGGALFLWQIRWN